MMGRMKTELEQALAIDSTLLDAHYVLLQFLAGAPMMMGGSLDKAREHAAAMRKLSAMRGHIGYGFVADQERDYAAAEKQFAAGMARRPLETADLVERFAGIELDRPAIQAARQNAKNKNIQNGEFIDGRVEDLLLRVLEQFPV